jgi:hypothetical protein
VPAGNFRIGGSEPSARPERRRRRFGLRLFFRLGGFGSAAASPSGAAASERAARRPAAGSAIGVLTLTPSVPAATRILPSTPSSTASTSIVALSVSISAITSPEVTLSPSFLSHLESVPSSIVGDSAGIRMSIMA